MGILDKIREKRAQEARELGEKSPAREAKSIRPLEEKRKPWLANLEEAAERVATRLVPFEGEIVRAEGGKFASGHTPNPGGRPRDMHAILRYLTGDGLESVAYFLAVARDEVRAEVVTAKGEVVQVGPSVKDRLEAHRWLYERVHGKTPDVVRVEATGTQGEALAPLAVATVAEVRVLQTMLGRMAAQAEEVEGEVLEATVTPALPEGDGADSPLSGTGPESQ